MQRPPEAVDISEQQYTDLLKRVEQKELSAEDWKFVLLILRAYGLVVQTLKNQKISLQKLKGLLFGKRTEKDKTQSKGPPAPPAAGDPGPSFQDKETSSQASGLNPNSEPVAQASENTAPSKGAAQDTSSQKNVQAENPKTKAPGHGRRPHDSWENANVIFHPHTTLKPGCPCPACKTGQLYVYDEPAVWVRFVGQPPLVAEINQLERLRCNPCGALFTATASEDLRRNPTSTPEARATAAIFKYQAATPFNRFAEIGKNFGHPIPRTRIWNLCQELAESVRPVILALIELAAQGEVVQNDDTIVRILQLIKENKIAEGKGAPLKRVGMYTTAIVAKTGEHKIYLFFSSRKHAGENLEYVLAFRDPSLPPPTQVCDASSMNVSSYACKTEIECCHDHARRNFFQIKDSFPASCGYALGEWKLVYEADAVAKKQNLSAEERMVLHQGKSGPPLERLYIWCTSMIQEKKVDPRGHLAKAMQYYIDHYSKLTLFLRKPGVPISNCECEQALKTAIGVRKMAYFFKTITGAKVADIMFTLIATCKAAGVGLYAYLLALQKNETAVAASPHLWLPWNYHVQLE